MAYTSEDLSMAERHVAEAERHVIGQEMIVTKLRLEGADTGMAEALLSEFEDTLRMHRHDRDRIAAELGE